MLASINFLLFCHVRKQLRHFSCPPLKVFSVKYPSPSASTQLNIVFIFILQNSGSSSFSLLASTEFCCTFGLLRPNKGPNDDGPGKTIGLQELPSNRVVLGKLRPTVETKRIIIYFLTDTLLSVLSH